MSQKAKVLSGTAGVVLLFAVIVVVNLIAAGFHGFRMDLTDEKLYTLSEGSGKLVNGLERPVQLKYYVSSSSQQMPINLKRYAKRIEDLLQEFAVSSGGKVTLELFDPKPDSDAEEWAQKYGVMGQLGIFIAA